VVIDTRNSDDGEFVLDDLFAWATATFGLREPKSPPKRNFLSSLIVDLDERVMSRMTAFAEIADLLAREMAVSYGTSFPYSYSKLGFSCDPTILPPSTVRTEFSLERRANTSFSASRFYCQSPFRTRTAVEILEKVERLFLRG
jgi:hypothetical protein